MAWGWRDSDGTFHRIARSSAVHPPFTFLDSDGVPRRVLKIVLSAAHVDRNLESHEWESLVALCQRCHLRHDEPVHRRKAAATRRASMNTLELFEG